MLCTCLALGLVAAGCGSSDDNDASSSDAAKAPAATEARGHRHERIRRRHRRREGHERGMKDIKFKPGNVTVAKGGTVTWTNEDSVGHDVTETAARAQVQVRRPPAACNSGDTFKQKFTKPGTFKYVCTVHPGHGGHDHRQVVPGAGAARSR